MVSPYKKKKLEKKGKVAAAVDSNSLKYLGNRRTRTSIKPLTDKKFYLDIKNHASLKKIEAKLTSLGARLELFLVREVDYVVTDREDYPRVGGRHHQIPTPSPLPSFCSVSPATPTSPHDGLASKRTRSRAEAMLERVKHQPQIKNTGDILDNALTWRIPIYPLPRFISWLEKVAKKAEKLYDSGGRIVEKGVRELRGTYLKVETSARPEFRQFSSWPSIALPRDNNSQQKNKNHSNEYQRMTRKVGKVAKEATSAPGGGGNGYCEMCRIHYDNLDSHVASVEHLKLVTDPTQYCHLDSIIAQHNLGVTSVRKSLRIAKSPPPYLPPEMGGRQSSEPTTVHNHHHHNTSTVTTPQSNGHLTRSKTAANCLPPVHVQCNGIEKKRSRTQTHNSTPDRTATPTPVPEHNLRPRRSLRATTPPKPQPASLPPPPPPKENTLPPPPQPSPTSPSTPNQILIRPSLPPPRRTSRVIRKRLSVEEKLIEDNKSYYKVEVLNSKLRSTEYFISQNKLDTQSKINGTVPGTVVLQQDNNKTPAKTPEKAPVVVRFKKVRKTELAVLSDEAESFMFGEPKRPSAESSESSEEDDEDEDEPEVGTASTPAGGAVSNARKAVHEEEDVKPSLPILQPPSSPNLHSPPPSSPPNLQHIKDDPEDEIGRRITFSFDMAPLRDPWLETYKRQDEGTEMYIPQHHSYPSLLLPYQLPQEKHYKRLLGSGAFSATGIRRRDRLSKLIDDRPRKSPRCHASTLAIMSSLMKRHRPGRECDRTFTYEEDSSLASDIIESSSNSERFPTQSQPIVPNNNSCCAVQQMILSAVLNPEGVDRIGEALLNGKTEISTMEPCLAVDPKAVTDSVSIVKGTNGLDMDISTLINTYQQCTSLETGAFEQAPSRPFDSFRFGADSCASSDCSDLFGFLDDGRVVSKKRKRKRNMTGWPQPKRKVVNSNTVKDILADQPPVDVNQFECVQAAAAASHNSLTTPLVKRRGRPPKNRLLTLATASIDSPSSTASQPPPPPPPPSLIISSPIKRKVHKFFTHRRSYVK